MNYKEETEKLLEYLKSIGHDRGKIEEKLAYAVNGIDQALARKPTKKLFAAIQLYKEFIILQNSIPNSSLALGIPSGDRSSIQKHLETIRVSVDLIEADLKMKAAEESDKQFEDQSRRISKKDKQGAGRK